jgi:hypothetical protein
LQFSTLHISSEHPKKDLAINGNNKEHVKTFFLNPHKIATKPKSRLNFFFLNMKGQKKVRFLED